MYENEREKTCKLVLFTFWKEIILLTMISPHGMQENVDFYDGELGQDKIYCKP